MKGVRRKLHQCMSELMEMSALFSCLAMDNILIFEIFVPIKIRFFWKCDGLIKSYTS